MKTTLSTAVLAGVLAVSPGFPAFAAPTVEPGPALRADFTVDQDHFVVRLPQGVRGHGHLSPRRTIVISALDASGREIARLERIVSRRTLTVAFDAAGLETAARLVVSAPSTAHAPS